MGGRSRRSKKRSVASSRSTRPPNRISLHFFVDECVSQRHVPDVLRAAGHVVHLQRDTYGTGTLDVDWLPHVGAQGWVLITKDQHIRKRPMELRALFSAKVRAFVLIAGELTGADQGEVFKKALASMVRLVWRKKPPFVAGVTAGGRIRMMDVPSSSHTQRTLRAARQLARRHRAALRELAK